MEDKSEMPVFIQTVISMVEQSVKAYLKKGFTNLSVNFGCTGGQHRSVYAAEKLAEHLSKNFQVNVELYHREMG